jgi:hypothetical protein
MFDYYETPTPATSSNVGKPTHLKPRTLGATVEQACWPLPPDARPIGSGDQALGQIAIPAGRALGGDAGGAGDLGLAKGLLLAAAGALAVKYLLPRGR